MIRIIIFIFLLISYNHAQSSNIVPYIQGKDVGLQTSPMVTGVRSSVTNQETELNIILFYHDKYDLREDEVLGIVEGRLISETPLSSFDLLKKIREDRSQVLSNYGEQYRIYQEALSNFQTFQKQPILEETPSDSLDSQEYYYYYDDDEEYYYYYYDDEILGYLEGNNLESLNFAKKNIILKAENLLSNEQVNPSSGMISDKELEYLIRLEILKKQYDEVVQQYNTLIIQEEYQDNFDPGDPTESFTIVILGEDPASMWTKEFGLDGVTNYQSYNNSVWYLGYRIPITKKDVRLLYNIFTNNEKIQYIVKGSGGSAYFNLSPYFIQAVNELVTLYARGKLKREQETDFPMLRNNDDERY
ncbi:MAG: hypothetical protein ACRC0X_00935 [Brevinema sp.]